MLYGAGFDLDDDGRSAAKFMVTVMKAKCLPVTKKMKRTADGYAVLTLMQDHGTAAGVDEEAVGSGTVTGDYRKTEIVRDTLFPIWDHDFVFQDVHSFDAALRITLMNAASQSLGGSDEEIGAVIIPLKDLSDQKWHSREYKLLKTERSAWRLPEDCAVKVRARFLWSKVARLAGQIRLLEAQQQDDDDDVAKVCVCASFLCCKGEG